MLKKILIALILLYKKYVAVRMPPTCKFMPTCSQYAVGALHEHGALRGGLLACWRVLRCNPFSRGGYDPVPPSGGRQ